MDRRAESEILSWAGAALAASALLLVAFSAYSRSTDSGIAVELEGIAHKIAGDIDTSAALALPGIKEVTYDFSGADIYISPEYVLAIAGNKSFSASLMSRPLPSGLQDNGSILWNDAVSLREYFNATLGAPGNSTRPLPAIKKADYRELVSHAALLGARQPLMIDPSKPLAIEKLYVYILRPEGGLERDSIVLVYNR